MHKPIWPRYFLRWKLPQTIQPQQILIIGHSMGGVIARALFLEQNYVKGSVSTILTLNSPHSGPPLLVDSGVADFYEETNRYWSNQFKSEVNGMITITYNL